MRKWLSGMVLVVTGTIGVASCTGGDPQAPVIAPCASDSDCVVYCDRRDNCCGTYCDCHAVVPRAESEAIERHHRDHCDEADRKQCPTVGGCQEPTKSTTARCRAGQCVPETVAIPPR